MRKREREKEDSKFTMFSFLYGFGDSQALTNVLKWTLRRPFSRGTRVVTELLPKCMCFLYADDIIGDGHSLSPQQGYDSVV